MANHYGRSKFPKEKSWINLKNPKLPIFKVPVHSKQQNLNYNLNKSNHLKNNNVCIASIEKPINYNLEYLSCKKINYRKKPIEIAINSFLPKFSGKCGVNFDNKTYCSCKDCCGNCVLPMPNEPIIPYNLGTTNYRTCGPCLREKFPTCIGPSLPIDDYDQHIAEHILKNRLLRGEMNADYDDDGSNWDRLTRKFEIENQEEKKNTKSKIKKKSSSNKTLIEQIEMEESKNKKLFLEIYIQMLIENKCDPACRTDTLHALYEYYLNKIVCKPRISPLLKKKNHKDRKLMKLANESPLQRFVRTVDTIARVMKQNVLKKRRFEKTFRKKMGISEESDYLPRLKYKSFDKQILKPNDDSENSDDDDDDFVKFKNEEEFMRKFNDLLNDKGDFEDRLKSTQKNIEVQEKIQKFQNVLKMYGNKLCELNDIEAKHRRSMLVNRQRDQYQADIFSIHMNADLRTKQKSCCGWSKSDLALSSIDVSPRTELQKTCPKKAFEKFTIIPGKPLIIEE